MDSNFCSNDAFTLFGMINQQSDYEIYISSVSSNNVDDNNGYKYLYR